MRPIKLLVVEDSPSDVRLIREALKETSPVPVEISVATDGVEALEHLRDAAFDSAVTPDLVLLDLNLPRRNGREVLAEIKSSPQLRQIPVVVMTSSRADEDIEAAYRLNANCYVAKPSDLRDYVEVIRGIEDFWFSAATLPNQPRPSQAA